MERAESNDDLDETLQTLRKNYEAILGRVEKFNKKPGNLFNNNVPLKLRPSVVDRALQKTNEATQKKNALPTSTPMVQNKIPIFTPEDSLNVSPIHQDNVLAVENNNNHVANNNTVITISSTSSETLLHASQTKIKHERISVRNFENSPESVKIRAANLESLIAKLTESPVNKAVQTSRKSLDVVKKMARSINTQMRVEIQEALEIEQGQREIQTQTGDSLNRKVSHSGSSGMSGLSDAMEIAERHLMTPKKRVEEQEKKGEASGNYAKPWRPSGLHMLPSVEFLDGNLSDDEESLDDDTFLPAKPPTKKVFTNKRKTLAKKTTTNRSSRPSKGDKSSAARTDGSVDRRMTRSSAKRLINVAIGTSSLEDRNSKSNRKKQKACDRSEEEAEIATGRTSTKGVQVQESIDEIDRRTKEELHVEGDVEQVADAMEEIHCEECTFDVKVPDEPVAEEEAPNKKDQSTRKKNNGILPTLTKKTRSVGDHDFQERIPFVRMCRIANKIGAEESQSGDENEIDEHFEAEDTRNEEISAKKAEVSRKDRGRRAKDLESEKENLIGASCPIECAKVPQKDRSRKAKDLQGDISSKKVQKKTVTEDLQGEDENLQKEEIPVKETEVHQKHRNQSTKEVKEVPATTLKEGEDFQEEHQRQSEDTSEKKAKISQKGRSRKVKESLEVPAIASEEISDKKRKKENLESEKENLINISCQTECTKVPRENKSRKAKEPRKTTAKNVSFKNVKKTFTEEVDKRQTSIESAEFAVEGSLVNEVFMEETTPNNEKVPSNNRKSPEKHPINEAEVFYKEPIIILSDVNIQQKKTSSTEVAGTSPDHAGAAGVSVPNQKALRKSPCRKLEWSDSSPPEIRTPPKKNKPKVKTTRTVKTTHEASTVSVSSTESTVRRSTRNRRPATPRFMMYYQCIASSGGKGNKGASLLGSSSSTKNRSGNQQFSIRTDAPTLEEIPEEDEPQPGPSQPKRSVISGRVSKRQNSKKSTKKAVKVSEELQKEGDNLLNFHIDGELKSFEWACKEPKYKPLEEIPGVSMAITVSVPVHGESMGFLKIEPGKVKPKLLTNKHMMFFVIIQGQGEVGVGDKRQMMTVSGTFVVPKGSEYYIKNTSKAKPLILGFTRKLSDNESYKVS